MIALYECNTEINKEAPIKNIKSAAHGRAYFTLKEQNF